MIDHGDLVQEEHSAQLILDFAHDFVGLLNGGVGRLKNQLGERGLQVVGDFHPLLRAESTPHKLFEELNRDDRASVHDEVEEFCRF